MNAADPRHGTTRGFHAGCRDLCCRRAIARDEKARRLDKLRGGRAVPAIGDQRRLQALMALGWSSTEIAAAAGLPHRNHVLRILNGQKGKPTLWVERKTHQWVCEVYEALSMSFSDSPYSARTRAWAQRQGFLPPLAWDNPDDPSEQPGSCAQEHVDKAVPRTLETADPVVVQRILSGEWKLPSNPAERTEVCRRWVTNGGSTFALAKITGWRVERYYRKDAA